MNSLKDKVAIITGAVGNLGTATARGFQQAGAHTVLVDRSPDRVGDVFKDIAGSTNHLLVGGIDLSDPASLGKLIELAADTGTAHLECVARCGKQLGDRDDARLL